MPLGKAIILYVICSWLILRGQGMREFVKEEELQQVSRCLESTPLIKSELGANWIANNLLNMEQRIKKHYLFWLFLESWKIQKVEQWLKDLRLSLPQSKYRKIINSLKAKWSEKDFNSLISELEVLAYYASKGLKVEYEPNIPKKRKVGDIKLNLLSTEVFIEVTRLFESKEEETRGRLVHSVVDGIDALSFNPFIITVEIEDEFSNADIKPCLKFVGDEIMRIKDTLEPVETKPYVLMFGSKATFRFFKKITHKKGYVGGTLLPSIELNDGKRLKNKILSEIEQLPDGRLNIIAIDISHHFLDFDDVEDGLLGQLGFVFNRQTGEGTTLRNTNGVVHMVNGKQVGLVVAFKGFKYEEHRKFVNLTAKTPFTEQLIAVV